MNAIKKNDIVELATDIPMPYSKHVVPKGTIGQVYRVRKSGEIYVGNFSNRYSSIETTADKLVKRETPKHNVKVGDVFVADWGYEQTNNSYFQIDSIKGKRITYHEISAKKTYDGFLCGHSLPVPDTRSATKTGLLRVDKDGNASFKAFSYAYAYPWRGEPCFFSEWH